MQFYAGRNVYITNENMKPAKTQNKGCKYFLRQMQKHLQSIVKADLSRNNIGSSTVHVEADLTTRTLILYTRP